MCLLYKIKIKLKITLYYSLIYPDLLYAIEVCCSAGTSDINSLIGVTKNNYSAIIKFRY